MKLLKRKKAAMAITGSIIMFLIVMIFAFLVFPIYSMIHSNRKIESAVKSYSSGLIPFYNSIETDPNKENILNDHFEAFMIKQFENTNISLYDHKITVKKGTDPYLYQDPALVNNNTYTDEFYAIYVNFKVSIPLSIENYELKKSMFRYIK